MAQSKEIKRVARHRRLRKKLKGTHEAPRLVVHRSLKHMHAQIVDDSSTTILLSFSTTSDEFRKKGVSGGNVKGAALFGEVFAQKALEKGIKTVVFDRGGYVYHGRLKAVAEALRKGGIHF